VRLDGPAQGTTYALTVVEAVSREGAPLDGQPTLVVRTPDPLTVEELDIGEDGPRATVKARPVLAFSQPIRDRRAAQAAISVDPPIAGRWEWLDDLRVRFTPTRPLPYDTEITFTVKPGRDGARSQAGSYVEEPAELALVTETDKVIDIDVTRQVMTLMQQGKVVRTLSVATGVPGADTPLGEFVVQYKMPQARFRGVNVNGSTYDIPDVKWVLAFMGDYTIHGAYWRSRFGAPGSNGCVSLTDADAKTVFDWAPEGTRIKIHY
jgi:lipoprotein-anchoring transpeptidase ErfK/SrfK